MTAELEQAILEVQLTIADRFTPAVNAAAHHMHVFAFQMSPWWRRWWHMVRGCEWGR